MVYVSFADWKTVTLNYEFTGLKWYEFLVAQPRFSIDVMNNLLWMNLGIVPTMIIAILLVYILEAFSLSCYNILLS